jgi:hypothetical protein
MAVAPLVEISPVGVPEKYDMHLKLKPLIIYVLEFIAARI